MKISDMQYLEQYGSNIRVKDLPLNELVYTNASDGDAKYDIYIATETRFCFFQAWENEEGKLRFDSNDRDFGIAFSIKKDNVSDVPIPDAHEGIGYFTLYAQHEKFPGTAEENGFSEHMVECCNIYAVITGLEKTQLIK